jgi:cobyrinic acid a,c-diamide synthase
MFEHSYVVEKKELFMKRLMIAGTHSGVGKTTLAMGIMAALSQRMSVQPYKVGPDYIDPAFHSYITGRGCRNLDSFLMKEDMLQYLFAKNMEGAAIGIVEGVMGLFDGAEIESDIGSSASVAKLLKTPVILVVDGGKVANSIAALVKGFATFDPNIKIAGVIINNVGSVGHYELLKKAILYHTDVEPCGYLLKNTAFSMPERHLGLVPSCEQNDLDAMFALLAQTINDTVDIEGLLSLADVSEVVDPPLDLKVSNSKPVRIGIAKDKAFNFYYQDGLDLLSTYNQVEWVPFSPLNDRTLPDNLQGLYFGGGFPEVFAKELSENHPFNSSVLEALEGGMPYIAECGGLMYLCDELVDLEGDTHKMVGWFKGKTTMGKRLQRFGYAQLEIQEACVLGNPGDCIRIHEFHRSSAEVEGEMVYELKKHRDNQCVKTWSCGFKKGNGVGAYAHMHFGSNLEFGNQFVAHCVAYKKTYIDQ